MMKRRQFKASIAGRLIAFSAIFACTTIAVAAVALWFVVTAIVREEVDQRLDVQIEGVRNALTTDVSGKVVLKGSLDAPPFDRPASGWYWQVKGSGVDLSSRSLFGAGLQMKAPRFDWTSLLLGRSQPAEGTDNKGTRLHFRVVNTLVDGQSVRIVAAAPGSAIIAPALRGLAWLIATMVTLGGALVVGIFLQVRFGLKPLRSLTAEISAVSAGQKAKLSPVGVAELVPIGNEINRLIELNDDRLLQTRLHFANLAHSLKTPVASLHMALNGDNDPDEEIRGLVARIELRLRHHLARARSTTSQAGRPQSMPVRHRIEDILDMMRRLYAERELSMELSMASDISVACSPEDFDEILGNIVDNACKWAGASIVVSVTSDKDRAAIMVTDDGPGLADSDIVRALEPGVRLDETVPGYGFGLSIAKELSALYGGSIGLRPAPKSGLVVVIDLPRGNGVT